MWTTITRLFSRTTPRTTMQSELTSARATLAELTTAWDALTARIEAGSASAEDFAERPWLQSRLQGAREAVEALQTRATRHEHEAAGADVMRRIDAVLLELGETVPKLMSACAGFNNIVAEIHRGVPLPPGASQEVRQLLGGLPVDFGHAVLRAIDQAAPDVTWHVDAAFGGQARKPERRRDDRVAYVGRAELPPNASGITNSVTGRVTIGSPPESDLYVG
jgi:hypothetical protein